MGLKIYIAGKISGEPQYREKFSEAQKTLENKGHVVMSPAILPSGFEQSDYMKICLAMIDSCEVVALLPDWAESKGATFEKLYAEKAEKLVFEIERIL